MRSMKALLFLSLSVNTASNSTIFPNQEKVEQATLPHQVDNINELDLALNRCLLYRIAAETYAHRINSAISEGHRLFITNELSHLKRSFLQFLHGWIHGDCPQELRAALIQTSLFIARRIDPYFYSEIEREGIALSTELVDGIDQAHRFAWQLRFRLLCRIFFNVIVYDVIGQEIKNEYLDFLFDVLTTLRRKNVGKTTFIA